jgi:hypothetical protein
LRLKQPVIFAMCGVSGCLHVERDSPLLGGL